GPSDGGRDRPLCRRPGRHRCVHPRGKLLRDVGHGNPVHVSRHVNKSVWVVETANPPTSRADRRFSWAATRSDLAPTDLADALREDRTGRFVRKRMPALIRGGAGRIGTRGRGLAAIAPRRAGGAACLALTMTLVGCGTPASTSQGRPSPSGSLTTLGTFTQAPSPTLDPTDAQIIAAYEASTRAFM